MPATQTKTTEITDLKAEFEDITPEMASGWLEKNERNRPLREDQVDRYSELMTGGDWMTSPDAIAFDTEGNLINGQHRLKACLQAGETIEEALVVWGLPKQAVKISDVGAKRTAADVLYIEGFQKYPEELGAVMKLFALWLDDRLEQCNEYEVVEKSRIAELAHLSKDRAYESMELARTHKEKMRKALPRSLAAFGHFLYKPTYQDRADDFMWEAFGDEAGQPNWIEIGGEVKTINEWEAEGVDISKYGGKRHAGPGDHEDRYPSPAKLIRDKCDKEPLESREKWLAWLIQSMNWYCNREPHGRLRYRQSDRFPEPQVDMPPEIQKEMSI